MTIARSLRALAAIFLASTSLAAQAETLIVVADEWPPFSGENLPNKGLSLDIITTALERAGYDVETRILPWARIISGVKSFEHDIVGSLFYDRELEQFLRYGDAYYQTEIKFVQRQGGEINYSSLDDLRPYSIVVGDGFLYEEKFDRSDDLNKIVVTTALQGVQMVAHGRADLTLDSVEVINYAKKVQDRALADLVEFLSKPLAARELRFAIRNDLPKGERLVFDFNQSIREMRADGSLARLIDRHDYK